jgi:hypothetical protein
MNGQLLPVLFPFAISFLLLLDQQFNFLVHAGSSRRASERFDRLSFLAVSTRTLSLSL